MPPICITGGLHRLVVHVTTTGYGGSPRLQGLKICRVLGFSYLLEIHFCRVMVVRLLFEHRYALDETRGGLPTIANLSLANSDGNVCVGLLGLLVLRYSRMYIRMTNRSVRLLLDPVTAGFLQHYRGFRSPRLFRARSRRRGRVAISFFPMSKFAVYSVFTPGGSIESLFASLQGPSSKGVK